jgi:hypothetical protein
MRRASAAATEQILSYSDGRSSGFSGAGEPVLALAAVSRVVEADHQRIAAASRSGAGSQDEIANDCQTSLSAVNVNCRRGFRLYTI